MATNKGGSVVDEDTLAKYVVGKRITIDALTATSPQRNIANIYSILYLLC